MVWARDEEGRFREHKICDRVKTKWKQTKRTSQKVMKKWSKTRLGTQKWQEKVRNERSGGK